MDAVENRPPAGLSQPSVLFLFIAKTRDRKNFISACRRSHGHAIKLHRGVAERVRHLAFDGFRTEVSDHSFERIFLLRFHIHGQARIDSCLPWLPSSS